MTSLPRVISHTGVITTAVPSAATALKRLISVYGIGRHSTLMPRSFAHCLSDMLVTDGSTEQESGVTYVPSLVMPAKFEVANSSMYLWVLASRYSSTGQPSFLAFSCAKMPAA